MYNLNETTSEHHISSKTVLYVIIFFMLIISKIALNRDGQKFCYYLNSQIKTTNNKPIQKNTIKYKLLTNYKGMRCDETKLFLYRVFLS